MDNLFTEVFMNSLMRVWPQLVSHHIIFLACSLAIICSLTGCEQSNNNVPRNKVESSLDVTKNTETTLELKLLYDYGGNYGSLGIADSAAAFSSDGVLIAQGRVLHLDRSGREIGNGSYIIVEIKHFDPKNGKSLTYHGRSHYWTIEI